MALPLAAASLAALAAGAVVWLIVLPAVFVVFALVEVYVDLLADVEVRTTRWLGPYLAVFYLAQWAVIGAAFLTSSNGGASVLVTYFVCLAATAWPYRKVGHGTHEAAGGRGCPVDACDDVRAARGSTSRIRVARASAMAGAASIVSRPGS
jgi:hypothetical protein